MTKKPKTGGRQPGTPNRTTAVLAERLEALGCDPLELSAKIALGQELDGPHPKLKDFRALLATLFKALEDADIPNKARTALVGIADLVEDHLTRGYVPTELRSKHIADLMRYVWAPRKAIEVTGADGTPLIPTIDTAKLSTAALRELAAAVSEADDTDEQE